MQVWNHSSTSTLSAAPNGPGRRVTAGLAGGSGSADIAPILSLVEGLPVGARQRDPHGVADGAEVAGVPLVDRADLHLAETRSPVGGLDQHLALHRVAMGRQR